jgi:hypothetical protein
MALKDPYTKLTQNNYRDKRSLAQFYPRFLTRLNPRFLTHSYFDALEIGLAVLPYLTINQNFYKMENGPISVSVANTMIKDYILYMTSQGIDMDKQTLSVSFTRDKLMDWLNKTMQDADELRICLGAYSKGDEHPGRLTVILWPYKNDEPTTQAVYEGKDAPPPLPPPTPPYNQGTLNP